MPTKNQLRSIEWAVPNAFGAAVTCPVCYGTKDYNGHSATCWLAAALATPGTLPPVEVGDVIWQSSEGYRDVATEDEARVCREIIADEIEAVYAPKWQRGKD